MRMVWGGTVCSAREGLRPSLITKQKHENSSVAASPVRVVRGKKLNYIQSCPGHDGHNLFLDANLKYVLSLKCFFDPIILSKHFIIKKSESNAIKISFGEM